METLQAEKRNILGKKVNLLRRQGMVPAVLYGKGKENTALALEYKDLSRFLSSSGSGLIAVEFNGEKETAFIQDIAYDPIKDTVIHVDFHAVSQEEEIETSVPLSFIGESSAVRDLQGVLVKNMQELKVKAKAKDIVGHIEVDVSSIETFQDSIKVKDLKVPSGFEILEDSEQIIAVAVPPRSEEEIKALEEEVVEKVEEVEGVKKEEVQVETPQQASTDE